MAEAKLDINILVSMLSAPRTPPFPGAEVTWDSMGMICTTTDLLSLTKNGDGTETAVFALTSPTPTQASVPFPQPHEGIKSLSYNRPGFPPEHRAIIGHTIVFDPRIGATLSVTSVSAPNPTGLNPTSSPAPRIQPTPIPVLATLRDVEVLRIKLEALSQRIEDLEEQLAANIEKELGGE